MITFERPAYAKVNLTLDVLAKRSDGYHDLESIFQAVSLHDLINLTIGTGKPWNVTCNVPSVPCDERNLVWKAAAVFCEETGYDPKGLSIHVQKRIPSEAGLGGGSADAAAVLCILNEQLPQRLPMADLLSLGAKVGSDVPFCILGGTAYAEGRGERLRSIPARGTIHYVLVKPDLSFSTPKLFGKIDSCKILSRPDQISAEQAVVSGDIPAIAKLLCNVFELAVLEDYPEIAEIKALLLSKGALGAQMTGSGSVVFGIFPTEESARECANAISSKYPNTFVCKSV